MPSLIISHFLQLRLAIFCGARKLPEDLLVMSHFEAAMKGITFLSLSNKNAFLTFIFPFNQGDTKMEDAKKRLCTV